MIVQEVGRWRSERTPAEADVEIDEIVARLTPDELASLQTVLSEFDTQGTSPIANSCAELEWEETPLPIDQWLESHPHIGDLKDSIYPVLKKDLIELFTGGNHEVILTGCIDKDALVQCSDGSMPTLGELIGRATSVATVDGVNGVEHHQTEIGVDSGVKRCLKLTLKNGMSVRLTPDHRVLTTRGWVAAQDLVLTDRVLCPRRLTYTPSCLSLKDEEVKLLAYWVTDGSSSATRARYCDGRIETGQEVISALRRLGYDSTTPKPYAKNGAWEVHVARFATSGFRDFLQRHGLYCVGSGSRGVPDAICRAPLKQVALFINRVWAAEGTVYCSERSPPRFQIAMKSERFIRQLQLLLLRWGIQGRVHEQSHVRKGTVCHSFVLQVSGRDNIERFHAAMDPIFAKEAETTRIIAKVCSVKAHTNVDVVPLTWGEANDLLIEHGVVRHAGDEWWRLGTARSRHLSRTMFDRFCTRFADAPCVAALEQRFHPHTAFERIREIVPLEDLIPVADIGVPGPTRFIANGIAVHNSTRWGKDYFATTATERLLYELCCLRDPARSLGLGAGETIHIVPISRTTQAAKRVVFGGLASKLALSPWFRGRYKETLDYIEFPDKRIMIVGGASSDAAALGLNVFSAIVDEGNFMGATKSTDAATSAAGRVPDRAQMIYDALVRRVKGTYKHSGVKGMIFLVSSKRATDDFTERRIREHIKNNSTNGVFVRDYATWHVRPEPFKRQKWYKVSVSAAEGRCRILDDAETPPTDALVFDFPEDFLSEFQRDAAGATRDIAGIATDTYSPFIARRQSIDEMFDDQMPYPFAQREWDTVKPLDINWARLLMPNAKGERVPACCPHAARHVHLDLSKNMCATGFTMAHQAGIIEVVRVDKASGAKSIEEAPFFHIDGTLRISATAAGEIDHGEVRGLVYRLHEGGINIRSVSLDHWMSVPNMQLFQKRGFKVEEISTVKQIDPYATARSAIYESRVKSPPYEPLKEELRALELDPKRSPDNPKVIVQDGATKDLADSFAGAIYYLSEHSKGGEILAPSKTTSTTSRTPGPQWSQGNVQWPDEEGYDEPTGDGKGDEYNQSWIV